MSTKFTWYGHACLGLENNGLHMLVDPFLTGNPAAAIQKKSPNGPERSLLAISRLPNGSRKKGSRPTGSTLAADLRILSGI
jgi:L-ascorbate metabolism protein UlaG (beta-lactamase superfamily)